MVDAIGDIATVGAWSFFPHTCIIIDCLTSKEQAPFPHASLPTLHGFLANNSMNKRVSLHTHTLTHAHTHTHTHTRAHTHTHTHT